MSNLYLLIKVVCLKKKRKKVLQILKPIQAQNFRKNNNVELFVSFKSFWL